VNSTLRYWWCAGFFVAWILYCFWWFYDAGMIGQLAPDVSGMCRGLTLALWPSSLALVSLNGGFSFLAVIVVAVSLVLNAFLYMGIGYVIAKVFGRRPTPGPA
jgi:hypothetical protein